jgi:NAD(P)-dependent dehydrogenase (short-subunit alcohol dehydrogenase family)
MRFEGKVALVTGAGSGIGEATARRFAREGAAVVVNDVNRAGAERVVAAIKGEGGKAMAVPCSITDKAAVDAMIRETVSAFGGLDILVNNAGINRDAMLKKMTEAQWDEVIGVNLKGTFLCAQAGALAMIDRGRGGRIINTSSIGVVGNPGQTNYSASKAGVIGMSRTLALELARHAITVNVVAPGGTETQMLSGVPEEIREGILKKIPLRRFAQPDEIAAVHAFLASDEAAYVTGQVLFVDGGITLGL